MMSVIVIANDEDTVSTSWTWSRLRDSAVFVFVAELEYAVQGLGLVVIGGGRMYLVLVERCILGEGGYLRLDLVTSDTGCRGSRGVGGG